MADDPQNETKGESTSAAAGASGASSSRPIQPPKLSRYESQKLRDWNTFLQYLRNQQPPVDLTRCDYTHVLDFIQYLDQFGKTKVHNQGCSLFGKSEPSRACTCPLRQAWGSLDALVGRLRAAHEENGGAPENNPFANGAIRAYLKEIRDLQAKARGIPYSKKKKRRKTSDSAPVSSRSNLQQMQPTSGL